MTTVVLYEFNISDHSDPEQLIEIYLYSTLKETECGKWVLDNADQIYYTIGPDEEHSFSEKVIVKAEFDKKNLATEFYLRWKGKK